MGAPKEAIELLWRSVKRGGMIPSRCQLFGGDNRSVGYHGDIRIYIYIQI